MDALIANVVMKKMNPSLDIIKAQNGQEAMDTLQAQALSGKPYPDLILLDLDMPVMNGLQFLRELAPLPHCQEITRRIAVLSSSIDPKEITLTQQLGARWFIQKPVTADKLLPILTALAE
jgi:CheY-like chemotaxis protein